MAHTFESYQRQKEYERIDASNSIPQTGTIDSSMAGAVGDIFLNEDIRSPVTFGFTINTSSDTPSGLIFSIGSSTNVISMRLSNGDVVVSAGNSTGNSQATVTIRDVFTDDQERKHFTLVGFPGNGTVALYDGNQLIAYQQAFNRRFTSWGARGNISFGTLTGAMIEGDIRVYKGNIPTDLLMFDPTRSSSSGGPTGSSGIYTDEYTSEYG